MCVCKQSHFCLMHVFWAALLAFEGRKRRWLKSPNLRSQAQKQGGSSRYSLFSTFIRFDSMKATFNLCSVYSWRRSSLAASIFRGFLEAWTRRLGLTDRLCSATEDVSLRSKAELKVGLQCPPHLVTGRALTWSGGLHHFTWWAFSRFYYQSYMSFFYAPSPHMESKNLGDGKLKPI